MTSNIKRSMAVRPAPIIVENGYVRFPTPLERGDFDTIWDGAWGYRVTRVTNSTDIRPGIAIDKDRIDQLISNGWTVSVLSKGR